MPVDSCIEVNFTEAPIVNNTVNINPVCSANILADIFYSITVPESGQIEISKNYTLDDIGLAIYDACYGTNLYCDSDFEYNQVIRNLPPNTEIVLQFFQWEQWLYKPFNFSFCINEAPLLVNDNCVGAISAIVNEQGSCEYISTTNLKFSTNDLTTSCDGNSTRDVFFKAIVPESGMIKINSPYYYFYYSVYDGCSGNNLICNNSTDTYGDYNLMKGLTPGAEIIIEVEGNYENDLQFCLEEVIPSENNICENAIPLDVVEASACIPLPVEIDNRFNSADLTSNCGRNISDSFYSITVPSSGKLSIITSKDDINIALFESCTGSSIFCGSVDYYSGNLLTENLIPGAQLIVQVFQSSYLSEFAICVADPVINTVCESATLLCNEKTSGTNVTAGSDSNNSNLSYDFYDHYDVWYQLQPIGATTIEISATNCINTFADLNVGIIKGFCGEMLEEVTCTSINNFDESIILSIDEIDNSQNYYLYISSDDYDYNDVCNFEINVIEGLEPDCCQFDVKTAPWCFPSNANGYYVDVIINDLGLNPNGYTIEGFSNMQITEIGTITLGPFNNGPSSLTFKGIDDESCVYTKTFDFDCIYCATEINHNDVNLCRSQTFKAASVIKSNANINSQRLNYYAKDSIILKPGFSVGTQTDFLIEIIEDCD